MARDIAAEQAVKAASEKKWAEAFRHLEKTRDIAARDVVNWFYYRQSPQIKDDFKTVKSFIERRADWPDLGGIRIVAEDKMPSSIPDKDLIAWFETYRPLTYNGATRYFDALLRVQKSEKDIQETTEKIRRYWVDADLNNNQAAEYRSKFGTHLRQEDHIARLERLLWQRKFTQVDWIKRLVPEGWKHLADSRIALANMSEGVDYHIRRIPANLQKNEGLQYDRLVWRRKKDLNDRAHEILLNTPKVNSNHELWWRERHIMIRRAIEAKDYALAYRLAKNHQQVEGFGFATAEWTAGWLALRFLNKPWDAFKHFEAMHKNVSTPISRSRAAFWGGLASLALNDREVAKHWFADAARYTSAFYGQLANTRLKELDENFPINYFPVVREISEAEKKAFEKSDNAKAVFWLTQAGALNSRGRFMQAFINNANTGEELQRLSYLANKLDDKAGAINVSKKAINQGMTLLHEGFPILGSDFNMVGVDPALVHAIIRQESLFDSQAISSAGARGYMQLMPGTAREMAQAQGLPYDVNRLLSSPKYNVQLGSAYVQRVLDMYDGYYVLAIASYNAGPTRVNRFIRNFGDPRTGEIDIIDWIEMIPIYETRNYVQRVLENLHVYRLRLSMDAENPTLIGAR